MKTNLLELDVFDVFLPRLLTLEPGRPGRPGRPPGFSSDDAPGTRRTGLVRAVCGKSAGSNGHTGCAADWLFAAIKTGVPTSPNMWNAKNGTQQLPV